MKKFVYTLVLGFFFIGISQAQYDIPKVPKKQTSVYDYVSLLSGGQSKRLENKLIRYSDSTSTQIVVIIINSTKGEDINYLAANWGEKWGIGQKGKDNGVVLMLAKGDRKVAIQAGRGTEGRLTDLMSKRIIEQRIIPEFKRDDYYEGLDKGTDGIFEVLTGEFKETRKSKRRGNSHESVIGGIIGFIFFILLIILVIAIILRGRGGGNRGGGRKSTSGSLLDILILSSMGSSSRSSGGFGSGGSFGGGGFSGGFGGGSFGGGGASGSW